MMIPFSKEENYPGSSNEYPVIKESPVYRHPKTATAEGMLSTNCEYKMLMWNLPVGVFKTTLSGKLIDVNPAFASIYGFMSVREAVAHLGETLNVFPPQAPEILKRLLSSNSAVRFEQVYRKRNGDTFIGDVQALAARDMEGKAVFLEGVVEDITARKTALAKLERSISEAKAENESQQRLFHLIAHDLRNPAAQLIIIHTLINKGIESANAEELRDYTNLLGRAAHNINELLNNLLSWSLLKTKRMEASPKTFLVKNMIEPAMRHLTTLAASKNIVFEASIESDDLRVFADEDMIAAALRNLGGNAIKYSYPGGKAFIAVSSYGSGQVLFRVSDQGVGIKKEDFPKLFQAHHPFTTRGANNEKGTGLGLFICKEFIVQNGGSIWVESEPGKGSNFYFTLPKA